MTKNCESCGNLFEFHLPKFCSVRCGLKAVHYKNTKVRKSRVCPGCGSMFVVEPYLEGKRRFHSLSCFNKWKKGKGINAGPKNVNWKGGISSTGNGYLKVTAGKHSGKLHHRYVMEQFLGHPIPCGFVVHHKDGNKKNNDIKNLQLMTNAEHINHHRNELLKWRRG